jgi:nucleoside-diphosphate-sugar epimerase
VLTKSNFWEFILYNILITGGLGYIGSILTDFLLKEGHNVTVLDNNMYKQNSLAHQFINQQLSVKFGDVRDFNLIKSILHKFDIVIPLAAYVGAPLCSKDPVGATSINKESVFWLLDNISPNQKIIMPTTNSAYGTGDKNNFCNELTKLNPISKYAIDKVEVEKRLMNHKNAISLRLATVFGMSPRMRIDLLVNDFVYRAVKDKFLIIFEGHFKRNYIHVRDVASCFIHCINSFERMNNEIYNVGLSDANISKLELCQEIKKSIPEFYFIEAEVGKDPDQRNYIVSNEKIELTGFKTKFSLNDGISELIKGFTFIDNIQYRNA